MFDYLEQLRNRPYGERKKVAVLGASIVTGVIVLVWISTFSVRSSKPIDTVALQEELRPFQEIKESAKAIFPQIKEVAGALFGLVMATTTK
ncbi:MAG: hypothetical protein NUV54_02765 [Candidatus Taylorbacteria bacterium]|nr:hypothetical protein [Candidatus Taylorbacteria bacterium]